MGSATCQSCGNTLTGGVAAPTQSQPAFVGQAPRTPPVQAPRPTVAVTVATTSPVASPARPSPSTGVLDGRVVQVDAMYMQTPDPQWGLLLLKLAVYGLIIYLFGKIIAIAVAILWLLLWLISKALPRGMASGVATQVLSFMLTRRIMGPAANIPVRDIRVRDANGLDHLARLKGHFRVGNVSVGDQVSLQGRFKDGTFLCKRGFNARINSAIELSQR
jgi:hypothetical protein